MRYKVYLAFDDEHGVVVAATIISGYIAENQLLRTRILQIERNAVSLPGSVVCDSQYGIAENFGDATAMGVRTHIHPFAERLSEFFEVVTATKLEFQHLVGRIARRVAVTNWVVHNVATGVIQGFTKKPRSFWDAAWV